MTKNPLLDVQNAIKENKSFVLQGGAGSGKTETLKQVIEFISTEYPNKKLICITHTNNAVDEIQARVEGKHEISTIHSFLNQIIKHYKKNIKQIIHHIYTLQTIPEDHEQYNDYYNDYYKKQYKRYTAKLYRVSDEKSDKVVSKLDFDKNKEIYIQELNQNIVALNDNIQHKINEQDVNKIKYNETRFDRLSDLSFGHDSLLVIFVLLLTKYPRLKNIICDKYDYILIDEYQDTNKHVMHALIDAIKTTDKTTLGLFGDSMQGIYDDGIGDIVEHIVNGSVIKINKEDNFRCSHEVVKFINPLRNDEIRQEVAFKTINGVTETMSDRHGQVEFYYQFFTDKPKSNSKDQESKEHYLRRLNSIVDLVKNDNDKILMLTNKSIANKLGFLTFYNIFNNRFPEARDEIEKELTRLQFIELLELLKNYSDKKYNEVICTLKKAGLFLKKKEDKRTFQAIFNHLSNSKMSAIDALNYAFEQGLMIKSEEFKSYVDRKNSFLDELESDCVYKELEDLYNHDGHTCTKLNEKLTKQKKEHFTEDEFEELKNKILKKRYFISLFSNELLFQELINYYSYLKEEEDYITMHKTKGSGIENVLVVLDEQFWPEYNFRSIYDTSFNCDSEKQKIRLKHTKLFYVACSRAIKNLKIVRLIEDKEEEKMILEFFAKNGHVFRLVTDKQ